MACGCRGVAAGKTFVWTNGHQTVEYRTEVEAKAQVIRQGGSYSLK